MIKNKPSFFLLALIMASCTPTDKGKINRTARDFMEGRMAFEKGDSTLLKRVTSDSLFLIIRLNQEYINLLDAAVSSPSLNFGPASVKIIGDKAECQMNSMENYFLNLRKVGENWIIYGKTTIFQMTYVFKMLETK